MGLFDRFRRKKKENKTVDTEAQQSSQLSSSTNNVVNNEIEMNAAIKMVLENTITDLKVSDAHLISSKGNNIPLENENNKRNFKYLNNLINSELNEIVLDSDIILDDDEQEYFDGIRISTSNLVIDGDGYAIDAKGIISFFEIYGDNITFRNINFKNGYSRYSGAIINLGGSIIFDACSFENNSVESYGGVILNHQEGNITLDDCRFENNAAKLGGSIFNMGSLNCDSCSFENSRAKEGGASIFNLGTCEFDSCSFEENDAQTAGGALLNINNAKFIDCDFKENTATSGSCIANEVGFINIDSSTFEDNSAKSMGGCIINQAILKISDSEFSEGKSENGGAISTIKIIPQIKSELSLKNCTFEDNDAERYGGAIECRNSRVIIENCNFDNGTADYGGGIYNNNNGFLDLKESNFNNNYAKITGGAILSFEGDMTLDDCHFDNNSADNHAGAIYNHDESNINIINSHFNNNHLIKGENIKAMGVEETSGTGGAICNHGKLDVFGCDFNDNIGILEGGAIENNGALKSNKCKFAGNKTEKWGGAIQSRGVIELNDSIFCSNNAQFGGAIYIAEEIPAHLYNNLRKPLNKFGNKTSINNCKFQKNRGSEGGAVANAGVGTIEQCYFEDNLSDRLGGAVMNYFDSKLIVLNCSFSNNSGMGSDIFNDGKLELNTAANVFLGPNAK